MSCGIVVHIFVVYWIINFFSTGLFVSSIKAELIENYIDKEKEIVELKNYFNSVVPQSYSVNIEFKSDTKIDLKVYKEERNSNSENNGFFMQWDINPYDYVENLKQKTRNQNMNQKLNH